MYTKWLHGFRYMLQLPTVIVYAEGDRYDKYDYMIEFTCKNESPLVEVTELRFSARTNSISEAQFEKMKQIALNAGISADTVAKVKIANHTGCDDYL